jgi:hypothetical protein
MIRCSNDRASLIDLNVNMSRCLAKLTLDAAFLGEHQQTTSRWFGICQPLIVLHEMHFSVTFEKAVLPLDACLACQESQVPALFSDVGMRVSTSAHPFGHVS